MSDETYRGKYTQIVADPPHGISWDFYPPKKGGKLTEKDVVRELFDQGMGGALYAELIKVPDEYPADDEYPEDVALYEPEDACKILAQYCHYTLTDSTGKVLTGAERPPCKPLAIKQSGGAVYYCPCGNELFHEALAAYTERSGYRYCPKCGQKIDWSDVV